MSKDFVDILKASGKLDERGLRRAQGLVDACGDPLHLVLCRLGLIAEEDMAQALMTSLDLAPAREHTALGLMNFYSILGATQEVEQLLGTYSSLLDPGQLAEAKRYVSRARENAERAREHGG